MERPDIGKPVLGPGDQPRLVGRTQSLEEANRIAEAYEMKGFRTSITRKKVGSVALYEVWASKAPESFQRM